MKRNNKAYQRLLAIWLILSIAPLAGGSGETFRVVRVTGERLHLRAHLPVTLNHRGVKRHLRVGEEFMVEQVRYGLRHTGRGYGDVWFFVRSTRNPDDAGWAHSKWLEEGAHVVAPQEKRTPKTATRGPMTTQSDRASSRRAGRAPAPAAVREEQRPPQFIVVPIPPESPWAGNVVNLLSVLASLLTIAAFSIPGVRRSDDKGSGGGTLPPMSRVSIPRTSRTKRPNYIYGKNWRIARK